MEHITEACSWLIDKVWPEIFDKIASTRRDTRERAIGTLTGSLNPLSEIDKTIYQAIPLEIAKRGDIVAAIWYIETIGNLWQPISIEVFWSIFQDAIFERNTCMENDEALAIQVIDKSIDSLFRMALKHPELREDGRLYMMFWKYQEIQWDNFKAIEYYNSASSYQHNHAYIALALIYEKMGALDMSMSILGIGYQLSGDIELLSEMVRLSCKMWDTTWALNLYWELQKKIKDKNTVKPFIFYKWFVENEEDLASMEEALARALTQKNFVPTDDIVKLTVSASKYLETEIRKENKSIIEVNGIESSKWGDTEYHIYNRAIVRRLWLMQIDILTLWDDRYLKRYLGDIHKLLDGTPNAQELLWIFFDRHFSSKILIERHSRMRAQQEKDDKNMQAANKKEDRKKEIGRYIKDDDIEEGDKIPFYESVSMHVASVWELFHHPEFYEVHNWVMRDILTRSARLKWEYDEEFENNITSAIWYLADETHYYLWLRSHVAKSYNEFVEQFDLKYGMYYRRYIQSISIRSDISVESYPDILRENPEIALLFWTEKIINNTFPANDGEEIDQIVIEYWLDGLNMKNALLFWSLIFDVLNEYAIGYLADHPNMLDVPEAIYIITEWIRQMSSKDRNMTIRDLHKICQEQYDARGFFDHINVTFQEIAKIIESEEGNEGGEEWVSDEDKEIFLLARANIAILQRKPKIESLTRFAVAASEFGSIEGFLQAGDSYKNKGEYDEAMHCYECAFNQEDTITNLVKILACTIENGRYDEAGKYIHIANERWYSIGNYILAFYLWQWKIEDAFRQMILMIRTKQKLIDVPKGLLDLLLSTLEFTNKIPDTGDFATENLKVQALYIRSCLITNTSGNHDSEIIMMHWQYCIALMDEYEWSELDRIVCSMLMPFTWEIDDLDRLDDPNMNDPVEYIDTHAQWILVSMEMLFEAEKDEKKREKLWRQMNTIKTLTISALQRFKWSDKYITEWRVRINHRKQGYGYLTQDVENWIPPSARYIH